MKRKIAWMLSLVLIVSNLWGMAAVARELPAETEQITQTGDVEAPESESQVSETESRNPESMRPIEIENPQPETSNQLETESEQPETESGQSAAVRPNGRGHVETSVMAMSNEMKPGDKIISTVGQNAEQLAQALLGNNLKIVEGSAKLTISNTKQAGVFSGGTELLGIESGIVLSTGDCVASFTKASSGSYGGNNTDPDLAKLVIGSSGDTAILEFQLEATGSLLNFQYVFGSREFDQSEEYNDVFGLFVKVNDGNFENLALLPSGDSVSIKNLVTHPEFYIADSGFTKSGFNGISNVLTAEKAVSVGDTVTIKLAICDVGDNGYDSSVMIKGGSLSFDAPGAGLDYGAEKLDGLEANTAYKITLDGVTYEVDSDDAGSILLKGTDNSGNAYDFMGKQIIIVRKGSGDIPDSPPQELEVADRPQSPADPSAPTQTPDDIHIKDISTTLESITIAAKDGLEYSIDNGTTWLKPSGDPLEVQFSGLVKDTEYTVQTRYGATDSSFASQPSSGVKVKTKNMFEKTDFIISPYSKAYDGKAHSGDIEIPVGANVTFATELNGSYGTAKPEFTNAGDYVVYYCVEKENYYSAYGTIDVKIKKQSLMVTPKSGQTKTFGQPDPVLDFNYDGQVGLETPGFTGALTREPGSEAGNYPILLGTLAIIDGANGFKESNYTLKFPAVGVDAVVFSIINQTVSADDFAIRGKFSEDQKPLEWNNEPITVTPANGYTKVSADGVHWMDSVTSGQTGSGLEFTFYLQKEDGTTTLPKTVYYNCDMDKPAVVHVVCGGKALNELDPANEISNIIGSQTKISVTAADETSFIKEFVYELSNGLSGKVAAVNNQGEFYIDSQYKGNITVTASDITGNVSDAMITEYIIVDKEKPTVPVITAEGYTPDEWISSEIAIKAENSTALSGIKAYEYSTDGGVTWTVMQVESTVKGTYMEPGSVVSANLKVDETGIHTYEFRALSNSGIYSDFTGKMEVRMDKEKPAVLVDANQYDGSWTNQHVRFSLSSQTMNLSGVTYEYSADNGTVWTKLVSDELLIDQNTDAVYKFRAVNGAGLAGDATVGYEVCIQKSPPENASAVISGMQINGWFNEMPVISIAPNAQARPPVETYYKLYLKDNEPGQGILFDGEVPRLTDEGIYELKVWTKDKAGNISDTYTETIKIDLTAPVVGEIEVSEKNTGLGSKIGRILTFGCFFKEEIEIIVPITDNLSGVDKLMYKLPGEVFQEAVFDASKGEAHFSIPMGTDGTIQIQAIDKAGNQKPETNMEKDGTDVWVIENTAPVISGFTTDSTVKNGWYNKDITLNARITDEKSGINHVTVLYQEGEPKTLLENPENRQLSYDYRGVITENGTTKITLTAEDNATNLAAARTVEVKLDKELPEMDKVEGNPAQWQNKQAVITFRLSDGLSGMDESSVRVFKDGTKEVSVQKDGGRWSFTTDGNGEYCVNAMDLAGNALSDGTIIVTKIQTAQPPQPPLDEIEEQITIGGDPGQTEGLPSIAGGWYTKNNIIITLKNPQVTDGQAPQSYYYKIWKDGENPEDAQSVKFDGDNPPSIKEDGLWNIGIWLQDEAGNTSEMAVKEFKVDTAVPQVSSENPELVINNGVAEKAEVQISDKGSGVKKDTVQVYRNGQAAPCEVIEKNGALVCTFDVDKGGIYTVNAIDEAGNSVEYTVTANARNAQVNNTEGIFGTVDLDQLLAAVDLSGYTNGETATLTLSLSAREASDVSSALKDKFMSLVRSDSKLYVFDVSLLLKVETPDGFVTEKNITMTDNKVDIILTIPEGIRGKYNYKVLRCHENQCDVISSGMDKGGTAITFGTDRFSEYALSYTDASKAPKPDNKKPGSTGAKTGDEAPIVWLFLITIVTTGIITTILFQMKKYRHR